MLRSSLYLLGKYISPVYVLRLDFLGEKCVGNLTNDSSKLYKVRFSKCKNMTFSNLPDRSSVDYIYLGMMMGRGVHC